MAKKIPIELQMTELTRAAAAGKTPAVIEALRTALRGKSNMLAARAARLVDEHGVSELVPELATAFDRFMVDPVSTDKGCVAKIAIAKTLYSLGAGETDLFLRGVRHFQFEAGWGKPTDVAGELRATSCLALVRMAYRDVMWEIAALFADKDSVCRMTAARACAYSERDEGLGMLRLRILAGDEDDVIAECFTAMVRLSPAKGIPFVAGYLESSNEAWREAAALRRARRGGPRPSFYFAAAGNSGSIRPPAGFSCSRWPRYGSSRPSSSCSRSSATAAPARQRTRSRRWRSTRATKRFGRGSGSWLKGARRKTCGRNLRTSSGEPATLSPLPVLRGRVREGVWRDEGESKTKLTHAGCGAPRRSGSSSSGAGLRGLKGTQRQRDRGSEKRRIVWVFARDASCGMGFQPMQAAQMKTGSGS